MIDGKMASILCGDSGSFCKYCLSTREQCSDLGYINEMGTFYIENNYEQPKETWQKLDSGEILYNDPERNGQVHKPLLTEDARFFVWMHEEPWSLAQTS